MIENVDFCLLEKANLFRWQALLNQCGASVLKVGLVTVDWAWGSAVWILVPLHVSLAHQSMAEIVSLHRGRLTLVVDVEAIATSMPLWMKCFSSTSVLIFDDNYNGIVLEFCVYALISGLLPYK